MTLKRKDPGAPASAAGASANVLRGRGQAEDNTAPPDRQIALLRLRWGLPPAVAATVAAHAWGGC